MFAIVSCTLFSFVVWPQLWPIHCCAQVLADVATCSPIDGRLSSKRSITFAPILHESLTNSNFAMLFINITVFKDVCKRISFVG